MSDYLISWKNLSSSGRNLCRAVVLYGIFNPILGLIMNAYFWRTTQDIRAIILFNGISFLLLPFVNYLSGRAMTNIPLTRTFALGYLLIALSPVTLFIKGVDPFLTAGLMGAFYALSRGLFFSNRNFLELNLTEDGQRNFYASITSFAGEMSSLLVPVVTGWFIVAGENFQVYTVNTAYLILEGLVIALAVLSTLYISRIHLQPRILNTSPQFLKTVSPKWQVLRKVFVLHGFSNGLSQFLPILIGMIVFKSEGILGSLTLLSSLVTMAVLAWWGRSSGAQHRTQAVSAGAVLMALGSFAVALFNPLGIVLYRLSYSLGSSIFYMGLKPLEFEVIEKESADSRHNFSFFLDESIYLNLGRVAGIGLCFVLAWYSPRTALVVSAVSTGALQLLNKFLISSNRKTLQPPAPIKTYPVPVRVNR